MPRNEPDVAFSACLSGQLTFDGPAGTSTLHDHEVIDKTTWCTERLGGRTGIAFCSKAPELAHLIFFSLKLIIDYTQGALAGMLPVE